MYSWGLLYQKPAAVLWHDTGVGLRRRKVFLWGSYAKPSFLPCFRGKGLEGILLRVIGCLCNGPQVLIDAPAKSCQHTRQRLLIISSWNDARSWEKAAPLTSGRNLNFNTRSKRLTLRKLPGTKCMFLGGSDLVFQSLMLIPHTLVYEIQAESFDSLQVAQLWFAVILWNAIRNTKGPINDISLKA